jgi:hypothetical protein
LSPQLQALMSQMLGYSQTAMNNPTAALAPIRNAGLQSINQTYASAPGQVAKQMAARGYGSSGSMGNAMLNANLARTGAVSNFEGQLAQEGIQNQQFGAGLGMQMLNGLKGSSSTNTTSSSGSSNGTSTGPDTSLASGLLGAGSGLGNLSALLTLQQALRPGSPAASSNAGDWAGEF